MKLEFNSVDELYEFIDFARTLGAAAAPVGSGIISAAEAAALRTSVRRLPGVSGSTPSTVVTDAAPLLDADDTTLPPPVIGDPAGEALLSASDTKSADTTEPAKRKRRTKAEIEADAKAEAEAAAARVETQAREIAAGVAAETATSEPAATTGTNPFEVAPPENPHPGGIADKPEEPAAEADTVVTPFQHLTRAREFIAKHGMPKYNESFAKAGLDPNVMGYTAYQRGLHMEALTALEQA